ncbi:MAG: methyltransferase domain-containing protein [Chloroflexota bacterium]|nr:methyltransferase domain-containing protein [Chloroflexota bacterium]
MSGITDRYDRNAHLYEQWWAPVLAPAAAKLLDRCDGMVQEAMERQGSVRILDIGTGTGALSIDAARRWPAAEIIATDASEGMLDVARRRAAERTGRDSPSADIRWVTASAEALGLPDSSIDLATSSFVFQLVPDRAAAYREILRVLRPGGRLHLVTWLTGRDEFLPADEFDEAVYDVAIDEEDGPEERRAGDFRSPTSAIRELRRAGFRTVSAEIDRLDQLWTANSYLDYKLKYDELGLVSDIGTDMAERLRRRALERLATLEPEAFRWRPPIVYLQGKRPGGRGQA